MTAKHAPETPLWDALRRRVADKPGGWQMGAIRAHARTMERDRARLIEALRWCKASGFFRYSARTKHNMDWCDGVDRVDALLRELGEGEAT